MAKVFKLDTAGGEEILKQFPGLLAALKSAAEGFAKDSGGTVTQSESDRARFEVSVPAHEQAIDGKLTKALGKHA